MCWWGVTWGNCAVGVQASISKPSLLIHLAFEKMDPFIYRCGAVVKHRTRDREVPGSIPTNSKCCFLEQETLSTLLSTGFTKEKRGPHGRLVLDY